MSEQPPGDVLDTPEAGRRVITGGAVRLAGYGAGLLASTLAAILVFRYLGKVDVGRFTTVVSLVTALQIVTELGLTSLGVREYAQRRGLERDEFMRMLLGLRVVTTALLVATATGVALLLGYDREMVQGAALMSFGVSLSTLAGTLGTPLQAEIRMGVVTAIDVGRQVFTAALYGAIVGAGAGIVWFLGSTIPIGVAMVLVTLPFVRGKMPLRPTFSPATWRELLAPTLTFALASAAGSIYVYGAMVLTELVTSDLETGDFAAAFRVYIIMSTFPILLVQTAFPLLSRAARDDHERLTYGAQRLIEGTALLGGATVVGLLLGAEPVIYVLGGREFIDAAPVLRIIAAALALTFVIATFGFTLMALHRHRAIIICNLSALAVSATAVVALGGAYGATGSACGVLLGEATLLLGYVAAIRSGPQALAITPGRAPRVVLAIAAGLAAAALPAPPVAQAAAGLVIFGVVALLARAVPDELLAAAGRGRGATD